MAKDIKSLLENALTITARYDMDIDRPAAVFSTSRKPADLDIQTLTELVNQLREETAVIEREEYDRCLYVESIVALKYLIQSLTSYISAFSEFNNRIVVVRRELKDTHELLEKLKNAGLVQ